MKFGLNPLKKVEIKAQGNALAAKPVFPPIYNPVRKIPPLF